MPERLISIIIPIFNSDKTLERCLKSAKQQSYSNIEIIMVNDGSTDNSAAICKQFADEDSRFRYVYQQNSGVSAARNNGLSQCRGEFFTFIDSDDWVEADYCRKMYDKAVEENSDMVLCGINYVSDGVKHTQDESAAIEDIISNGHIEHFLPEAKEYAFGSTWRILFRTAKLGNMRFDESLHIYEDLIFLLENVRQADKLSYVNDNLYNYDLPQVQYLKKYYRPQITDTCYLIGIKLQKILKQCGREEWAKAELFKQYYKTAIWVLTCGKSKGKTLREFKRHRGMKEFNSKENYKLYKQLYELNKFKAFLIHNKLFFLYRTFSAVKKVFHN
ncbi:MAG: glycosyltransferase family 2 protein [Clostridia bacterium]|nr:glycosyltransferase family 2 protein [Clostridia bacterium]